MFNFHCSSKIGVVFFSMFAVNTGGLEETNDAGTGEKHCLKKSSKVVAALRKVVLDKQWLNNLTFMFDSG